LTDFIKDWLAWLLDSASLLPQEEQAGLLSRCGERCAQTGILEEYRKLFLASDGDPDRFFSRLHEIKGVSGAVVTPGSVYEIVFHSCLCDLYTSGFTDSDMLCECSRGSVAYVMRTLMPKRRFTITKLRTILGGSRECRFLIEESCDAAIWKKEEEGSK